MNIPIETIFAMLAIEVFRTLARADAPAPPRVETVLAVTAAWVLLQYSFAATLAHRTRAKLRRARGSTATILEDFRFRLVVHRVVLVILCFVHIHYTRWPTFVERTLRLPEWSVLDDVVAVAPFVAALAAGWLATYRADKLISRRDWGLGEYVWFQARYSLLLVMLPWLVLRALADTQGFWPADLQNLSENATANIAVFAIVIGASATFLPLFLKRLFRAVGMPPSDIRRRLEALSNRAGLAFRDILVWRMGRARILNAAVMGVVPRYRYVLFSGALLESLSPAECEAVLGHEIGHMKHRHVLTYLVFTLGFVALAYNLAALLPSDIRADFLRRRPEAFLVGMPILAILVTVYFRFLFGYLSRALERQADVYAAGLLGTPVPLVLALEKIALMSGDVREVRSWRHYSVAERVEYLSAVGHDAEARARYHASMRRLARAVVAAAAVLFAGALYFSIREPADLAKRIAGLRTIAEANTWDDHTWTRLGELLAESGDAESALDAYRHALSQNPSSERSIEGVRALEVPEALKARTLARSYMAAGRPEKALEELDRAVAAEPDNPLNYRLRALAALMDTDRARRDPAMAAVDARCALDLERDTPEGPQAETYVVLARALLEESKPRSAEGRLREGLARYPDNDALKALLERAGGGD